MSAELDQEIMDWLQDHVLNHDSVSVREVPVRHGYENLDEHTAHEQYLRKKEICDS